MKEMLKKLIAEGWDFSPAYVERGRVPSELATGKASLVISGPRRAGKSFTSYEISELMPGEDRKSRLRINFEDERLTGFKKEDFDSILEAYYEMGGQKPAVFFDEIQNIGGWDAYIRRLADNGYKVVVTGSNSRMLSREIAERLGGRFVETTVYPLDFLEFLKFKGMEPSPNYLYSRERFAIRKLFGEYLSFGGFPEIALLDTVEARRKVLESYFNLVFYKDLVSKRKLENENALKFMIKKLREGIGRIITPSSVYSALLTADIGVGPNTVEKYINYLEEAYLVLPCHPFAKSVLKQERKKRYFADNGYITLLEVKDDSTLLLENLVFMELVKNGRKVNFHQGKHECDFIVDGSFALQVTHSLSDENRKREINGLLEAIRAYGLSGGAIITLDQETEMSAGNRKICIIPAWKWCLSLHRIARAKPKK